MDAFEYTMAVLLERKGYWIKQSYKVNLTKEEKRKIGRASTPRWEIDIIAYKAASNELLIVECKSFLNSAGVGFADFSGQTQRGHKRYKLFNEPETFEIVRDRIVKQLIDSGSCLKNLKVKQCLAVGNIKSEQDERLLREYCDSKEWLLFDRDWILQELEDYAASSFENETVAIVAKLLLKTNR